MYASIVILVQSLYAILAQMAQNNNNKFDEVALDLE